MPARRRRQEAPAKPNNFRKDVQGLRAIAVGIVLLYHAELPFMPGGFVGVDVFFVISGFLITGGIVRELRRDGTLSLKNFYVRRIARILPAATVTLLATAIATWLLLPETRWVAVGRDVFASTLYYVNWLFAESSVDYLAQDQASSPLQHFWSLAVEEQFYIVWPALLLAVGALCLRLNASLQKGLLFAVALVGLPSLAWSVYYTVANPGGAYFVTTTRMWELAIGAGLAIAASKGSQPPKILAASLGWAGLAAIGFAAFTYTGALPFPSYTALLPTLGAAAVLWGGQAGGNAGVGLLLNRRFMVFIGSISYSLYLWHWPMLVIIGELIGGITPITGTIIILASVVPAFLSYRYLELRAQEAIKDYHGSKIGTGFLLSLFPAVAAVILMAAVPPVPPQSTVEFVQKPIAGAEATPVGAELLAAGAPLVVKDSFATISPAATNAAADTPVINQNGCMNDRANVEPKMCPFGDPAGEKVIALIGDSHAAMLAPGFNAFAGQNGYRLDTYTKGACPFVSIPTEYEGTAYTECNEWVANVTAKLTEEKPALVVIANSRYRVFQEDGTVLSFEESKQPIADNLNEQWRTLQDAGVPVSAVRMTPRPDVQIPDCVAANPDKLSECALPSDEILWSDGPEMRARDFNNEVNIVDLSDAFCADGRCPAVIEGILVYRDNNHITATYARTLDDHIADRVAPLLGS
ncbi:acyltransferase family protein [Arthrobacter sp. MDT3-44]